MRSCTLVLFAGLFLGCQGEPIYINENGGQNNPPPTTEGALDSASKLSAFLDGTTLTMEGSAIPSHPNGFNENVNFGQATQCYMRVVMKPLAGKINIASDLGTLENAPNSGDVGTCNRSTLSAALAFDSTAVLYENIQGDAECFDFTVTFPGFGQEGRGKISSDRKTLVLELFFKDQAVGHRCADGAVGSPSVTLNQNPFMGNAQQTYTIN